LQSKVSEGRQYALSKIVKLKKAKKSEFVSYFEGMLKTTEGGLKAVSGVADESILDLATVAFETKMVLEG